MFNRNRWLARLSFSFFILAAVLAWQAYKVEGASEQKLNAALLLVGAVVAAMLGAAGVRARHRRDDQ